MTNLKQAETPSEARDNAAKINVQMLENGLSNLETALGVFGFDSLRPGQDEVVYAVLAGSDVIAILPTSTGKTASFIIPALANNQSAIIFSPLISLMRDQAVSLQEKGLKVDYINSHRTDGEINLIINAWSRKELQFLIVAPERLENDRFRETLRNRRPDLLVVDEAHVMSEWCDTFRSSYKTIGNLIPTLQPRQIVAATATCTPRAEADIRRILGLGDCRRIKRYPIRHNLKLHSRLFTSNSDFTSFLVGQKGPGIIYYNTVAKLEKEFAEISDILGRDKVSMYHGQMPDKLRPEVQDMFMRNDLRVVCATCAFGMGVDKPDVRWVVHRNLPTSLEALIQEQGRAGRDQDESHCTVFYSEEDRRIANMFISWGDIDKQEALAVYEVFQQTADRNGVSSIPRAEVAKRAGVFFKKMAAMMELLYGEGCLAKIKAEDKPPLMFRKGSVLPPTPILAEALRAIAEIAVPSERDPTQHEFHLRHLAQNMGRGEQTVRSYLRKLNDINCLQVMFPPSSAPVKLVRSPEHIDFERLRVKTEEARGSFEKAWEFCDSVEDEDKHAYLRDYIMSDVKPEER